uniref:S-adenosyl-L-methionine-dependent methyltransferase n=1 Tax=Tanacetum cinerariifolium TaxID=118510 RepID=A0A6L2MX22_TANCI|nr:S-adenosyl-L-methionine-dependent methyltransferase [Tanacetum cinerariifolium]
MKEWNTASRAKRKKKGLSQSWKRLRRRSKKEEGSEGLSSLLVEEETRSTTNYIMSEPASLEHVPAIPDQLPVEPLLAPNLPKLDNDYLDAVDYDDDEEPYEDLDDKEEDPEENPEMDLDEEDRVEKTQDQYGKQIQELRHRLTLAETSKRCTGGVFKENHTVESIDVLATYRDADPPELQEPSNLQ